MGRAHSGAAVSSVAFSSSGNFLLTAGCDSCVRLWDVGSGRELRAYEGALLQTPRPTACFAHDEAHVLCADEATGAVIVWAVPTGEIVQRCAGHTRPISAVAHSPAQAAFLSCAEDGQMRMWSAEI
mmetsp:Transcript_55941/g.146915  ORF Transcript_55941/g.146915 Transcript_55941/m.146915 type:complete len:126 (+) Transcript_55941:1-378(+)